MNIFIIRYDIHHPIDGNANNTNDDNAGITNPNLPKQNSNFLETRNNENKNDQIGRSSSLSDIHLGRKSVFLEKEEKRASVAASLLVELIGVDNNPVKPYYPVLVIYATLYLSHPLNRQNMHKYVLHTNLTILP